MTKIVALFEDEDDKHLVGAIALSLGLEIKREPISLRGYDPKKLTKRLSIVAKEDFDRLVIVLDADREPDGGPARRWAEVLDALRAAKLDIPSGVVTKDGLIHDIADDRRVAVWLFPDCRSEGAMEDFVIQRLIADGDALLSHAAAVVEALPDQRFAPKHAQKARMRSWLAWQKRPGLPPGRAVSEKVLEVSEARLGGFGEWLRRALG